MRLFISDLHLGPHAPGITERFIAFLHGRAHQAEALYILGDLFEAWIGDDDLDSPAHAPVCAALQAATRGGLEIALIHGNRDFLLGEDFANATGVQLLPDPYVLSTAEWQFVLSHGDALCLGDGDYMRFRHQVRDPAWQQGFLARPLAERRAIAEQMRRQSEASQAARGDLTDLDPAATDDFLRQHGYATFIHGHTHQPATHDHIVDGIHVERWVLADWHVDRGECLVWDGERLRREAV